MEFRLTAPGSDEGRRVIKAQQLRCGDNLLFQDKQYLVLSSNTDDRHQSTVVTCLEYQGPVGGLVLHVTAMRLYRHLDVVVPSRTKLSLNVIDTDIVGHVRAEMAALNPIA